MKCIRLYTQINSKQLKQTDKIDYVSNYKFIDGVGITFNKAGIIKITDFDKFSVEDMNNKESK